MAKETADPQALARKGFRNGELAAANLERLGGASDELIDQIAGVAGPDTALSSLAAIADRMGADKLLKVLAKDRELRQRLLVVLGTSEALGEFVARHPEFINDLSSSELSTAPISLDLRRSQMSTATNADELRINYYRKLLHLAWALVTKQQTFDPEYGHAPAQVETVAA